MWRRMMRTWLICAAMAISVHGSSVSAEDIAPPEDKMESSERDSGPDSASLIGDLNVLVPRRAIIEKYDRGTMRLFINER